MDLPTFMLDEPNWMNAPELPETVFVNLGGTVHRTRSGIHLASWLRQGGQLVPDPEAPAKVVEEVPHPAAKAHIKAVKE